MILIQHCSRRKRYKMKTKGIHVGKYMCHPKTRNKSHRGGVEMQPHSFLTLALDGVVNDTSRHFAPRVKHRYPLWRKLGGPESQSGLVWERDRPLRTPGRPARSKTPYRTRYPSIQRRNKITF